MRQTCQVAANSIKTTIRNVHCLHSELQAAASVEYECKMKGASYMAYPSVVASGENCTVIHYTHLSNYKFDKENRDNDLLLIDAGCEYGGYTSDITRTWPLSGHFDNLPKRLVYEAVLDVQQTLIKALQHNDVKDGFGSKWTVDGLYHEMKKLFRPHLVNLGLIDENSNEAALNV